MTALVADLRHAVRLLVRSPGFTFAALAAIALGIGANTAMFTVVNAVLLKPLPYPQTDRIVNITRQGGGNVSPPMAYFWQQSSTCFDDYAVYDASAITLNLSGGEQPEQVRGLKVSLNYFRLFGAVPIAAALERQMLARDVSLPPSHVRSLEQLSLASTARQNFNLALLSVFAAIALVLAAVGIYGVMSYSVEQRTREIGIRAALGAGSRDTLGLVLGEALRLAAAGTAVGLVGAFGLTRLIRAQLWGVTPSDPLTFAVVACILLAVAVVATLAPMRRALRVDPAMALRYE